MSERSFKKVKETIDGVFRTGVIIECSKRVAPDCEKNRTFFNAGGRVNYIHASKIFRNNDWIVGGGPRNDICPKCMLFIKGKHPSQLQETDKVETVKVVERVNGAATAVKKTGAITQEDKRVIFGKLDEVYDASKGGYLTGWNDKKVSDDLGCPKEWVSTVRDALFGPETSADDFKNEAEQVRQMGLKIAETRKQLQALIENIERLDDNFNTKLKEFENLSAQFQKRYDNLMRML